MCCGASLALAQGDAGAIETRARKLESELTGLGFTFAQPVRIEAIPAGEFALAGQAELERVHGKGWVEAQNYLRQALGIDAGKTPAETRVVLASAALGGMPLFYRTDTHALVVDTSRAGQVTDQELVRGLVAAARDAQQGLTALYGGEARTIESVVLGRALVAGEGELAALVLQEQRAKRDPKALNATSLEDPLAPAVANTLTRLIHRHGRDLAFERFQGFGWEGVRALYDERPQSSEQLAHRVKLYRDAPKVAELPAWDAALGVEVVRKDELGELGLYTLMLDAGVPDADAQLLSIGWDGDELQLLRGPEGALAMVWRVFFDRPDDVKQFVSAFAPRALGQVIARGNSIDWVRADSVPLGQDLLAALEAARVKVTPNLEDRESTAEIESALTSTVDLRPRIEGGRWVHPRFALSIPAPDGWVMELINGRTYLMGPQIETFKDNISVVALDAGIGATLDELLEQQRNMIRDQGFDLVLAEKRTVDNREVLLLRYTGSLDKHDLVLTTLLYVYEGRPIVVTMTVARANLEWMQAVVDTTIGGTRFVPIRPGRSDASR